MLKHHLWRSNTSVTSVTRTSKMKTSVGTVVILKTPNWSCKCFVQSKMGQPGQALNLKTRDVFRRLGLLMKSKRCLRNIVLLMEHLWTHQAHKTTCSETLLMCSKSMKHGNKWFSIASPTLRQQTRKRTRTLVLSPVSTVAKLMEIQSRDLPSSSKKKKRKSFWTERYHSLNRKLDLVNKEGLTRRLHCVWKA